MASAPDMTPAVMSCEEEAEFLDAIQKWIDREIKPAVVMHHDHGDIWPAEIVEQMREMGLFGATIGQEYGGLGLPATTYAKIVAMIASHWMAITGIFNSHLIMACAVERFGTTAQKVKWLPKFASGEIRTFRRSVRRRSVTAMTMSSMAQRRGFQTGSRVAVSHCS
jgi:alkylation response protein AidB-like acyl-CoA dehydrogenase